MHYYCFFREGALLLMSYRSMEKATIVNTEEYDVLKRKEGGMTIKIVYKRQKGGLALTSQRRGPGSCRGARQRSTDIAASRRAGRWGDLEAKKRRNPALMNAFHFFCKGQSDEPPGLFCHKGCAEFHKQNVTHLSAFSRHARRRKYLFPFIRCTGQGHEWDC